MNAPAIAAEQAWALIHGDSLALLRDMGEASIGALATDPPYGLGFLDRDWDSGDRATAEGFEDFSAFWGREVLRVLKPGAWGAIHCAPRTVHRLVAGLEDAGFEVKDQIAWALAGVTKARKLPGGYGTSLAPNYEPVVLVRRPLSEPTTLANIARHGTGGLNIEAARIPRPIGEPGPGFTPGNLALTHHEDCAPERSECLPDCPLPLIERLGTHERETGKPFSRLLHVSRASSAEREAGLEALPPSGGSLFSGTLKRPRVNDATVKPLGLLRHIVKLIAPPGGIVLDPFAGSGSSGCAAVLEGRRFVGIEADERVAQIARARLTHWAAIAAQQAVPSKDLRRTPGHSNTNKEVQEGATSS